MRLSASAAAAAAAVIDGLVLLSIEPPLPWRGVTEHVMATGICLSTAAAAASARPVQPHWACREHRHGGHLCHPCDSRAGSGSLRCVLGEGLLVEFVGQSPADFQALTDKFNKKPRPWRYNRKHRGRILPPFRERTRNSPAGGFEGRG